MPVTEPAAAVRARAVLGRPGATWPALVADGGLADGLPRPGAPGSMAEVAAVAAELGRHPDPLPYQTWLVGPMLTLSRCGGSGDLVDGVAVGATRTALAEGRIAAARRAGGWVADGDAPLVPFAVGLDLLLVTAEPTARRRGNPRVLAVPADTPGVTITPARSVGDDRRADVAFRSVTLDGRADLGELDDDARRWVAARRTVAAAAEMVGSAAAALDHATEYATRRRQFGQPIGSFQAVAHRLADAMVSLTVAADAVADAVGRLDAGDDGADRAIHGCGALVPGCCGAVVSAAHQVVGGTGIYAESPLHRWFRRVHALAPVLGDPAGHRGALAEAELEQPAGHRSVTG